MKLTSLLRRLWIVAPFHGVSWFTWASCLGLDYVSHEDILPYNSTDQVPIQHELFERFLIYDQTKGNFLLLEVWPQ